MSAITEFDNIQRIVTHRPEQLAGFTVKAVDGEAGRVSEQQEAVDADHLAVHVGGFLGLMGHDVSIEVDTITAIDPEEQAITVNRVTEWVKESPRVT